MLSVSMLGDALNGVIFSYNWVFLQMERPTEVEQFPEMKLTHFKSNHN
jgi:hypothetical protein